MKHRIFGFSWILFLVLLTFRLGAQQDSLVLTFEEYLQNITDHHPLAKQADLKTRLARAEWLGAKGNFDPVISSGWNQKNFDNKLYYRQFNSDIKVPTRLGIDFVGGYENTEGVFLNPENTTDPFGLWKLGIEANVLQGLFINERQTALEQARVFQDMAEQQRLAMLNDLVFRAGIVYLNWRQYYDFQEVLRENIEIASIYFENTKASFEGGEKSALDTLEAYIMLQDAQNLQATNITSLIKNQQNLENFLWLEDRALTIPDNVRPQGNDEEIFIIENENALANIPVNHPVILEKRSKQSIFQLEQRLNREMLKPKFKVKYNPLLATRENDITPTYTTSDFEWGFDFSLPIFLRKERADIQKGEIKLQEIALEIAQKQNELINKAEASLQQEQVLEDQIILQRQNVSAYKNLLDGEQERFLFGESSVFLLNKRQEKYISGQLKLIALKTKLEMIRLEYLYYSNDLLQ